MKNPVQKPTTVEEYIKSVPLESKNHFSQIRALVLKLLPNTQEVFSYGIIGYKIDDKRARVFISGWKDHTAIYPIPKDEQLQKELKPYIKGKGTLWFSLEEPLPKDLISKTVKSLTSG